VKSIAFFLRLLYTECATGRLVPCYFIATV
jgi:hypothetical protein